MKKIALVLAAAALVFAACSNGADSAGFVSGGSGGTQSGGGVNVDDDGIVTINSKNLKYIGEGTETVDTVEYKVKKYADLLLDDNPYFYTYYKFYYLDGKLRRLYVFKHGVDSDMDHKYTDFEEHFCASGSGGSRTVYTYYENGKKESITSATMTIFSRDLYEALQKFYTNGNLKLDVKKTGGKISTFTFYYSSGYIKYYYSYDKYDGGKFNTFADNKNKEEGWDESLASSHETLTPAQAEAKLAELMNE